tara:strand:- start:88 stop:303 length:216 start_codon:yes stop_codon:yes gene_type:complete
VLGSSNDRLLHVPVLYGNNVGIALLFLDKSSTALESAVRHAPLLSSIENNRDTVAGFVCVHDSADVQATTL